MVVGVGTGDGVIVPVGGGVPVPVSVGEAVGSGVPLAVGDGLIVAVVVEADGVDVGVALLVLVGEGVTVEVEVAVGLDVAIGVAVSAWRGGPAATAATIPGIKSPTSRARVGRCAATGTIRPPGGSLPPIPQQYSLRVTASQRGGAGWAARRRS